MKYKFNGVDIDSVSGCEALGIPPGTVVPVKTGDIIECREYVATSYAVGKFNLETASLQPERSVKPETVTEER